MSHRFDWATTTRADAPRVSDDLVAAARGLPTATLHEAGGKIGALPSALRPIAPGMRADLNVIDYARLKLHSPAVAHDLPAGGRRLIQRADGYVATIVAGRVTYRDGEPTDALPGRLLRGAQSAPVAVAAE